MKPRAASTDGNSLEDGFTPEPAFFGEMDPRGGTRLVVSVPGDRLRAVHEALLAQLKPPLGVLWRQVIDRKKPRPNGSPPIDHVGLDLSFERVLAALRACGPVVYEDARAELWIRGKLGEQLILDQDGLVYAYPDDPVFRDALEALGLTDKDVPTLAKRDFVKHWYHAEHDALEARLVADLGLTIVGKRS
jgi:hypothetical protein